MTEKLYGTTLLIGCTELKTKYATFTTYTYQDVIDKKYVMALCYGDLANKDNKDIYIRVHSSCLTSETLRSLDCDCVNQLNGALEKIVEKGCGILFYLLQSGRGASYISKSRGCQLVQYFDDKITTFDAYKSMGLKSDYRDYRNVKDIIKMLDIQDRDYYLMTNNPDKISKLKKLDVNLKEIVSIEFKPNIFNQNYLISKQQTGHLLHKAKEKIQKHKLKQPSVEPFKPYNLENAQRFIHCSTYYIPVEPIDNQVIIRKEDISFLKSDNILEKIVLPTGDYLIKFESQDSVAKYLTPYWFKTHVYYDIASHTEYVVLTYGDIKRTCPIVRIHSEFIFNRFPLIDTSYKNRYNRAIMESILNNSGIIIIENHNGDNQNLGEFLLNRPFDKTGIRRKRFYLPSMLLLKHHIKQKQIRIYYSSRSRKDMERALKKSNIKVLEWICIEKEDKKGHTILRNRIRSSFSYLDKINNVKKIYDIVPKDNRIYVTGIGTSEAHAKYFVHLANKNMYNCQFLSNMFFYENSLDLTNAYLIVITQGMSPHGIIPLENHNIDLSKVILLTAVTVPDKSNIELGINMSDKKNKLMSLQENGLTVYNFPLENEYITLIRTIGPLCGYDLVYKMFNDKKEIDPATFKSYPDYRFIKEIIKSRRVIIVLPYPFIQYYQNLKFKLIEGAFLESVEVVGELDLAHGIYQNAEHYREHKKMSCFILVNITRESVKNLLEKSYPIWEINTTTKDDMTILEIEHLFNILTLNLITELDIDQVSWYGKETQKMIYEL